MSSNEVSTRDRILKSAWTLLEQGGGSAVRMSDIAKQANVSRQAVYLHFPNRADLLTATTRYIDEVHQTDAMLVGSRTATSGTERLEAWIDDWGNYIPLVYGVSKALLAMKDSDPEAAAAWNDRIRAVRDGCKAAVLALSRDNVLHPDFTEEEAIDFLWTLQAVRVWEQLRHECGWSQDTYLRHIKAAAFRTLVR